MVYQINSSKLFLTYPQCTLTKEEALQHLQSIFNIKSYVIASELHANGDPHLHVYLELPEAYRTRDPRFADLQGFHGNYQGCRSSKNVLRYCTKDDNFISNVDVSSLVSNRSSRADHFRKLTEGNLGLREFIEEHPQYLLDLGRLESSLRVLKRLRVDPKPNLPIFLPNTWGKLIRTNLFIKKRHYWIYSDKPNYGKTTNAKKWATDYRAHHRTGSPTYWNLNFEEQLVIHDEYNVALYPFYDLNAMCDSIYEYRVFQGGVRKLPDFVLHIVLSNYSPREVYPNRYDLIEARFNVIKLD